MPVAIFNPNPRYIFSYEEVQKEYGHYDRVTKSIYEHCASAPTPLEGQDGIAPAVVLEHLKTFCQLTTEMFHKADAMLVRCLRVLEKHIVWLLTTKSKTTNRTQLRRIAEAEVKISKMKGGLLRCRGAIIPPRERFEKWAVEETKALRERAPDNLVEYQFQTLISHIDHFANFMRLIRKTCLRLFVVEDDSRRG